MLWLINILLNNIIVCVFVRYLSVVKYYSKEKLELLEVILKIELCGTARHTGKTFPWVEK